MGGNNDCFDTSTGLSHTQDLLQTVDTLHELRSSVYNVVSAWTKFATTQMLWLESTDYKELTDSIRTYRKNIEAYVAQLENEKQLLDNRCSQFEGRYNRV